MPLSRRAILLSLLAPVALVLAWRAGTRGEWTDGRTIRTADATSRDVLWTPATPVESPLRSAADLYAPRISPDGLTMVMVRGRAGANADLYLARRTPQGWSEPEPITDLNTTDDELAPAFSHDGRTLYFASNRAGGQGGFDLWASTASGSGWSSPTNLGPRINSAWNDIDPCPDAASERLYFASNRPRPGEPEPASDAWPATLRERRNRHDYDLFRASLAPDAKDQPSPLTALNTADDEGCPALAPAGDFLYFASDRAGGLGGFDLWRARLLDADRLGPPEHLDAQVNSPSNELDPAPSDEGFRLTFSSDRSVPSQAPPDPRDPARRYALWSSTSREVYRQRVAAHGALWLGALIALASIALLLALARLLANARWRERFFRLSLLAQCLLLSLVLHGAIASLLAVWRVGSGLLEWAGSPRGTRVVLASGGAQAALSDAIRVTSAAEPEAPTLRVRPSEIAPTIAQPAPLSLPEPRIERSSAVPVAAPLATLAPPVILASPEVPAARSDDRASLPDIAPQTRTEEATPGAVRIASPSVIAPAPQTTASPAPALPASRSATPAPLSPSDPSPSLPTVLASGAVPAPAAARDADTTPLPAQPIGAASSEPSAASRVAPPALAPAMPSPSRSEAPIALAPLPSARAGAAAPDVAPLPSMSIAASPAPMEAPARVALDPQPALPSAAPARSASAPEPAIPTAAAPGPNLAPLGVPAPSASSLPSPALGTLPRSAAPSVQLDGGAIAAPAPALLAPPSEVRPSARADDDATRIPDEPVRPREDFAQRDPQARQELVERGGGNADTERAVARALDWLARHQSPDGRWSATHFDDACGRCADAAQIDSDASMTGLALLCFLGAGHTHQREGPYQANVRHALDWLVARQDRNGDLRRGETMYAQTVATVALCEALAMTSDQTLALPTRRAVALVVDRAASGRATSERDASVLGWLVFTLESARRAGIDTPKAPLDAAARWLDSIESPPRSGRFAYARNAEPSPTMTAEALFVRQILGQSRESPAARGSARFVLRAAPRWGDGTPTHFWYYATLAMFQQQGPEWAAWNRELVKQLLEHQRTQGPAAGSWDPADDSSRLAGRVYQTAICTLNLEVYYRYRAPATPPSP